MGREEREGMRVEGEGRVWREGCGGEEEGLYEIVDSGLVVSAECEVRMCCKTQMAAMLMDARPLSL
jgi:hypothetical protein